LFLEGLLIQAVNKEDNERICEIPVGVGG